MNTHLVRLYDMDTGEPLQGVTDLHFSIGHDQLPRLQLTLIPQEVRLTGSVVRRDYVAPQPRARERVVDLTGNEYEVAGTNDGTQHSSSEPPPTG